LTTQPFSLWRLFGLEKHHQLLLKWMIFTGVALFAFFVAVHYGLVGKVFESDKSYISIAITLLYLFTSVHCMIQILFISAQMNTTGATARQIAGNGDAFRVAGEVVHVGNGDALKQGVLAQHVRDLVLKARIRTGRLDQTLLLRAFEDRLKAPQEIGFFIADLMLRLGLLGTVVGFILMLGPLAAIQNIDVSSMRQVLSAMSSGMAVALYTTLCGLIGGILLKLQYYFLEGTTEELIAMATEVTEVYVIPVLETMPPSETSRAA
jgi:hypothetical protein